MAHHLPPASQPAKNDRAAGNEKILWRYSDPGAAQKDVQDDYEYWTGKLTDLSFQLSLAIIGANWAAFKELNAILHNGWAKASLSCIILGIAINLIGTKHLGELLRKRLQYAEADPKRWKEEYEKAYGHAGHWPFTAQTDDLARRLREVKTWFPLISGALFLIGLLATRTP